MACHDDVLLAAQTIVRNKVVNQFTIPEVFKNLSQQSSQYSDSTVRTHITSRCCKNTPDNHAVTYEYFERIRHGVYQLTERYNPLVPA